MNTLSCNERDQIPSAIVPIIASKAWCVSSLVRGLNDALQGLPPSLAILTEAQAKLEKLDADLIDAFQRGNAEAVRDSFEAVIEYFSTFRIASIVFSTAYKILGGRNGVGDAGQKVALLLMHSEAALAELNGVEID